MKKKLAAHLVFLALAILVCLPLVACSGSSTGDSDALKQKIESTLAELKSCEGEPFSLAEQAVADAGIQEYLDDVGLTDEELCRAYLDSFDYQVGEVSVTGSSAQAKVTFTRRSITAIAKAYLLSGKANAEEGKQVILDAIDSTVSEQKEATIYISKTDGGEWDVTGALSESLHSVCL
ncbi:hypothetical protein [Paratractidigestivibacter sp.]|uniref:hypothetical protein n=1 Tax=Paratractidigestivibacter sp. TaxID=2847316 RepID=UPI002ABD4C9C|nr:hypothetical protein [Paratractidigestivibacter sp.]